MALSKEIKVYGDSLNSIASSTSIDELEASLDELSKTLGSFGETLFNAEGSEMDTTFSTSFSPILGFFNYLTLSYLDYRKNVAIKSAVQSADPLIKRSAVILKDLARLANLKAAQESYVATRNRIGEGLRDSNQGIVEQVEHLLLSTASLKTLTKSDPGKAYNALVDAHGKVLDSFTNKSTQFKDVVTALNEFKAQVQAVSELP